MEGLGFTIDSATYYNTVRHNRPSADVNGDTESFRSQSVVKEELVPLSMKEMLAIYIHLRQTLIGQPAITSVAAGVAGSVPQPLTVSYLLQISSHI